MDKRVQLLVHAGASSSRKDDERYAAQAAAYLDHGTSCVSKIIHVSFRSLDLDDDTADSGPRQARPDDHQAGTINPEVTALVSDSLGSNAYIGDTQLAYTMLESQLFTSSAIVQATPVRRSDRAAGSKASYATPVAMGQGTLGQCLRSLSHSPDLLQAAPVTDGIGRNGAHLSRFKRSGLDNSETDSSIRRTESAPVSQSSHLRSPMLGRSPKKVRLNGSDSSSSQPSDRVSRSISHHSNFIRIPPWAVSKPVAPRRTDDSAEDTVTTDETTSELPASYSLSDVPSESLKEPPLLSCRSKSHPGPSVHSLGEQIGHVSQRQQPAQHAGNKTGIRNVIGDVSDAKEQSEKSRHEKRPRTNQDHEPTVYTIAVGTSTKAANAFNTSNRKSNTEVEREARKVLQSLSWEIRPPPAPTSMSAFKTHATKMLQTIAKNPAVADKFEPVSVRREVAVHERGHWLMDWARWPTSQRVDFWRELEVYIGNGNAGWCVWCTRGPDEMCDDEQRKTVTQSTIDDSPASNDPAIVAAVRVYCWGEIVRHVYLLLYTLSSGRVRKLGLQWIDAAGETIVQMRGPVPTT